MRRGFGYALVVIGVFLLVLGPTVKWVVAPKLAVAPLECTVDPDYPDLCDNGVSLSPSEGVAATLFNPKTLTEDHDVAMTALRRVKPDRETSTAAETVYETTSENATVAGDYISGGEVYRYAFDGHTSQMLDCCNANVDGEPIVPDGDWVMPLKFGFGVEKKDYLYYDDTILTATPAVYTGTDEIDGVEVYVFEQVIEPTQIGELEVPGDLVGSKDPAYTAPRFYTNTRTLYVEPTTGVIVNGTEHQIQTLRGPDGTDQLTLIDTQMEQTADNVANAAQTAKDGKSQLNLITNMVPIIAIILGLVLTALGAFLVLGAREEQAA